jgi:hypothetical protein
VVKITGFALWVVFAQVRGTVCHGLTEVVVENTEQVMALLADAETRCRVSETKMNKQSKCVFAAVVCVRLSFIFSCSRAHRILTLLASFSRSTGQVVSI